MISITYIEVILARSAFLQVFSKFTCGHMEAGASVVVLLRRSEALLSEGRGREFESRRARHLVLVCEHDGRLLPPASTVLSSTSLLPLIRT
jgi:hypothetical protein